MNDSALVIEDITLGLPIRDGRTLLYRRKRCKTFITVLRVTPINLAVSSVVFRMPKTSQTICQRKSLPQGAGMFLKKHNAIYFCH